MYLIKNTLFKVFLTSVLLVASPGSWSQDLRSTPVDEAWLDRPYIQEKHLIPSAIQLQITPRGTQYFGTNLSRILGNIGVSFDEGIFEPIKIEAEKPIKIEELDASEDTKELLTKVRSLLTDWLIGFPLKEIRPAVEIGSTGYKATFQKFALVADEELLNQLGKTEGAVLAIEVEVKEIIAQTDRVRAYQMGAPMLGQVGFDDVQLRLGGTPGSPVKVRMPFWVRIDPQSGQLRFEALHLSDNIRESSIELKYRKLVAPQVVLEINGYRMEMSQERLEKELQSHLPDILNKIRGTISDFAQQTLPALLNEKAAQALNGSLEEINRMEAPGETLESRALPLFWGLQLQRISQKNGIQIGLQAFVEDPKNPKSAPIPGSGSRGPIGSGHRSRSTYDIGMSLDRGMVNRILQLSFERQLFKKVPVGAAGYLEITQTPTIDWTSRSAKLKTLPTEEFIKANVRVRVPPGTVKGLKNKAVIKDNFEAAFDLILKLQKIPTGPGIEVFLHEIDLSTLWINPNDLTWAGSLIPGTVLDGVKEQLADISKNWKNGEVKIPGTIPLPPEILGIKLDIQEMLMDPNGHLILYLNYAETRNPRRR